MSIHFKIILCFIFMSHALHSQTDILKSRVYQYNHIKPTEGVHSRIDSTKVIHDLNYFNRIEDKLYAVHILKKRENNSNYISFFYLLILLFFLSILRYSSFSSINYQILQFVKLKVKNHEEYGVVKSIFILCLFILIVSFVLHSIYFKNTIGLDKLVDSKTYNLVVISIFLFISFKYIINLIIVNVFKFKSKFLDFHFLLIDFMYIFVSITLPVILFSTVVNLFFKNIIIISVFVIFSFMYFYFILKLYYNNLNLLTRHVIKFIIYSYSVEIIPILLLLKYLKTFVV